MIRYGLYAIVSQAISFGTLLVSTVAILGFIIEEPILSQWNIHMPMMALPTAICLFCLSLATFLLSFAVIRETRPPLS